MTLATRTDQGVQYLNCFDSDEIKIVARYTVEGLDKVLMVHSWASPELLEEPAGLDWILKNMDDEAEWCAAHPDDVLESTWAWT